MKNPKLFHRTIDVLTQAYFEGHLKIYDACCCVIGNLVADKLGMTYDACCKPIGREPRNPGKDPGFWFAGIRGGNILSVPPNIEAGIQMQCNLIGYTPQEVCEIESAACGGYGIKFDNFDALMAVVEVLQKIHKCTEESTQEAKSRFTKKQLTSHEKETKKAEPQAV